MEKERELTETEETYKDLLVHGLNSGKLVVRDVTTEDDDVEYHVVKRSRTSCGRLFARALATVVGDRVYYKDNHAFCSVEVYDACLDSMRNEREARSEKALKKRLKALKRSL